MQAYDPSGPIATVMEARAGLAEFGPTPPSFLSGIDQAPDEIDLIAMILTTLNQPPDRARVAKAHGHFLQMIAQNRAFWARVEGETDNDRKWLPNDRQVAALGVPVPPETGKMWQAVLTDAEALLTGQKLIPYWRAGDLGGINLQRVFLDPRPLDLAGWLQGWTALPYMQTGPLVSAESWSAFENMLMGDAMLFAIWFNRPNQSRRNGRLRLVLLPQGQVQRSKFAADNDATLVSLTTAKAAAAPVPSGSQ